MNESAPQKPGSPPLSREECERRISVIHEALEEGFPWAPTGGGTGAGKVGALGEAARRLNLNRQTLAANLDTALRYGLAVDPSRYRPTRTPFTIDALPPDGDLSGAELVEHLVVQSEKRIEHDDAKKLYTVRVGLDGPIGIAFFGDPHVDSNGTDWKALKQDVEWCQNTEGVLAVNVGDSSDNWVGRLMALYANSNVTARQSLKLIEWLLASLPWLLTIGGNHDLWHTETSDPIEIIHRMREMPGLYQAHGARLRLVLPSGAEAFIHVRHDFPGRSQFNAGHAFVRETLFGYRDHILACGHRHQSGYIPIWHNDPRRLCHGFRTGSYKKIDSYKDEKHFKDENWAPAMMAIIDPDEADDPVEFITPCFSLRRGCKVLTERRREWKLRRAQETSL